MTDSVVVEGYVKFRDGKKWKTRWVVLRKPSPVADCLVLLLYKDKSDKAQVHRERGSITLEDICGLETGLPYEGVGCTLAILCLSQAVVLGFDSKEAVLAWDIRIRYSLGEVHRFSVGVLPGTKLESGPATLHLCNNLLVLARDIPPIIIGQWNLPDLRRYGPVPNGFVFEGGTRCGYWAGVFFLSSMEGEQISFLFDCIVRGISPTRGPFGLRPVLPDPNASQSNAEERVNHEAQELEKRLSMLSHQSSTASSTYSPSVAGDDRSISGSSDTSDTSQSDSSVGSRLAIWTEPVTSLTPSENIGQSGAKVASQGEEKLSISQVGGARPMAKPPQSRQLQEIGRQSSSDSGIATGSHSSYSGSFSSYAGSLDISPGDEFGSMLSLPPHLALDLTPCTCPPAPGHEYQVPTSLRYLYDTPRSLLQGGTGVARGIEPPIPPKDQADTSALPLEAAEGHKETHGGESDTVARRSAAELLQGHLEESKGRAPPSVSQHPESCQICSSAQSAVSKTIFTICSTCGRFKGTPLSLSVMPAIPEPPMLKPAGESIDKRPCRPISSIEYNNIVALMKATGTSASPAIVTSHSSERLVWKRTNEEPALQNKGIETLDDFLAYLDYSCTAGESGSQTNRLNLYESMASALGCEVKFKPLHSCGLAPDLGSQEDKQTIIYENCFKCKKGEDCNQPPKVTPVALHYSRSSATLQVNQKHHSGFGQSLPSGPCLENVVLHEDVAKEEQPTEVQLADDVLQDGNLQHEKVKGHSVSVEDKKSKSKEERRKVDPAYEIMEGRALEKNSEPEEKSKYELMGICGQQRFLNDNEALVQNTIASALLKGAIWDSNNNKADSRHFFGAMFVFPPDMPAPDRPRGDGVTYVNIPISPMSKKQLNYMELELQDHTTGVRGTGTQYPGQRKSSTKYAQIDITATETAHKVGTQHALGREEGLHTLEQRRRGAQQ